MNHGKVIFEAFGDTETPAMRVELGANANPYDGGCLVFCCDKRDGADGKIELGQEEATRLRDALTEWLEGRHA